MSYLEKYWRDGWCFWKIVILAMPINIIIGVGALKTLSSSVAILWAHLGKENPNVVAVPLCLHFVVSSRQNNPNSSDPSGLTRAWFDSVQQNTRDLL